MIGKKLETTNVLKKSGKIYYDNVNEKLYTKRSNNKSSSEEEHTIELSFESDENIPVFENNNELIIYLQDNANNMNGIIKYTIDEKLVYEALVVDGVKQIKKSNKNILLKAYPCTLSGLTDCAVDTIKNFNWLETAIFLADLELTVPTLYAVCSVDNC